MLVVLGEPGGVGVKVTSTTSHSHTPFLPVGSLPQHATTQGLGFQVSDEAESELQGKVRMDFTIWGNSLEF